MQGCCPHPRHMAKPTKPAFVWQPWSVHLHSFLTNPFTMRFPDNYQSNIIVTSLTRSNSSGAIGFMNSPEHLNVLISRARDGLILIGNSKTFKSSKSGGELWRKFFDLLQNGGNMCNGFPVKCEWHPTTTAVLKSPAKFNDSTPDGGCTQPW